MSVLKKHTPDDLCRKLLEDNSGTILIQKPEIAVKKLKVIIAAALKLSNEKGFQAMSLRDLSKESGISMGGLYAYFDSKKTLLHMILSTVTTTVEDVLAAPPAELANDPIGHLNWLIDAHIRLTEDMLPWFTFSFMEAKNFPRKERRMATDSEELTETYFTEVCERAKAQSLFREDVPEILPALIKPLLQDWYVKRPKYKRRKISVETYIGTVQDFILRACLHPNADLNTSFAANINPTPNQPPRKEQ